MGCDSRYGGFRMSQLRVIEVVTALVFMFYAAALISSGLVEWLANVVKKRAKYLLRGINGLLEGSKPAAGDLGSVGPTVAPKSPGPERKLYAKALASTSSTTALAQDTVLTAADVMSHPLVRPLAQSDASRTITRLPSYLSSEVFTDSLLDLLGIGRNSSATEITAAITKLKDGDLKQALQALLKRHEGDVKEFGKAVERWYDHAMDRVSGAYKRWSRRWLIVVGLLIAVVMHLDAVGLAKDLWSDETSRAALIKAIDAAPECTASTDGASTTDQASSGETESDETTGDDEATKRAECIDKVVATLSGEGPPIGPQAWGESPEGLDGWLLLILGLLLTGSAAALGAPFWFDALGKLNSLRNAGPKPPKSEA
jgi:hypothetical protein